MEIFVWAYVLTSVTAPTVVLCLVDPANNRRKGVLFRAQTALIANLSLCALLLAALGDWS
jgi:hypothetical protein